MFLNNPSIRAVLLLVIILSSVSYIAAQDKKAYIRSDKLNIRDAPSRSAQVLGILEKWTPVNIIERSINTDTIDGWQDAWYKVTTSSSPTAGWVFGGYLVFVDPFNETSVVDRDLVAKKLSFLQNGILYISSGDGSEKKAIPVEIDARFGSWSWRSGSDSLSMSTLKEGLTIGGIWSPDGKRVVAPNRRGISVNGVVERISGQVFLNWGANDVNCWFPDSRRLIIVVQQGTFAPDIQQNISVFDCQTRKSTILVSLKKHGLLVNRPSVAPDGSFVTFIASTGFEKVGDGLYREADRSLYLINSDGTGLRKLWQGIGSSLNAPVVLPDGKSIILTGSSERQEDRGLFLFNIPTGKMNQLSDHPPHPYTPASVSPDGKYVVYDSFDGMFVVRIADKQITRVGPSGYVQWGR
jgi:Bacterial SH3 domain